MSGFYYLPANTVLCAAPDDAEGKAAAIEYARFNKLDKGDVKIARRDGLIIVVALKPVRMSAIELRGEGSFFNHLDEKENKNGD